MPLTVRRCTACQCCSAKPRTGGPANAADSRHAGDLGNLQSDATGSCHVEFQDKLLALHGPLSIIGRSVIMYDPCAIRARICPAASCTASTLPRS